MRRKLLVLPVLAAGLIGLSHAQPPGPPGGFGGEGGRMRFGGGGPGGGMDPETIWGFVSKGQPSINLNDPVHAKTRDRMQRDGTPIPADGILTKDAFKANFQASMQKRMAAGGGAPGGAPMQFQMGGPPGGSGGSDRGDRNRGGGGFDPSTMTEDQLREFMRPYDTDGDGRISAAEAASGRSREMRERFAMYDANRDGFMDVTEYRAYNVGRFQERMQQSPGGSPGMPGSPMPFQPPMPGMPPSMPTAPGQTPATEEARPEVMRYGKLPKGAPSFMLAPTRENTAGLDADRDGQIGLYEWRRAGKKTAEFVEMDLNGDGYLTYTEYKSYIERVTERQKQDDPDAPPPMVITPGGPSPSGDRSERGPKGDRTDRKGPDRGKDGKGDRKGPRNPFANGNKGG